MQRTIHPLLQNISSIIILLSIALEAGLSVHTATLFIAFGAGSYLEEIQQEISRVSQVLPALRFLLSLTEIK